MPVPPLSRLLALAFLVFTSAPAHSQEAAPAAQQVDVAVYSGVPCGIAAAIAAARQGARVLLIEPTKHVGGMSTSGINTAESEHMLKWTIGGFALEFYQRLGRHYGSNKAEYYFSSGAAEQVYLEMLREAGVEVLYGHHVERVEKAGARLQSITLQDGKTIRAKAFIDASYEGDLMARAGVSYVVGREGRAEFGEEAAGVRFDKTPRQAPTVDANGALLPGISGWARDLKEGDPHHGVMNYNFRLTVTRQPDLQAAIPPAKNYDPKRYALLAGWLGAKKAQNEKVVLRDIIDFYNRRGGRLEMNNRQAAIFSLGHFGAQFAWPDASYAERERIFQDHWDYTLGLVQFLSSDEAVPESVQKEMKAVGLHTEEFKDNGHLPYQLYVREARRMRGAYIVRQQDVQDERRKDDAIGISSHFIDCHHVQRLALSPTEFINEGRIWRMGWAWQIPYRALTPKPAEADNLLVPGAASLTHVAFCTYRLESVWMIAGQAAGIAAAMSAQSAGPIQSVDMIDLQARLRSQGQVIEFIPGQLEKCDRLNGPPEF